MFVSEMTQETHGCWGKGSPRLLHRLHGRFAPVPDFGPLPLPAASFGGEPRSREAVLPDMLSSALFAQTLPAQLTCCAAVSGESGSNSRPYGASRFTQLPG
ncbi:hypothetical protein KIL84_005581 [Mauremys mutica]|uniref:Uncharacterized protein n=1 Tax=Mauremys mutica TaxID=74926 RepID=A0A9D3XGZ2_9SAUR|nr:hypothetical protein KIL84_005581 [Mauremys mutica]